MAKTEKKELLGKGIRSLLQNINTELKNTDGDLKPEVIERATAVKRIALDKIIPNPEQPRKDFHEQQLNELAESIRIHNIIQPLTVTDIGNGKYRLVAGERRYRASKIAGLEDVPVYVRELNDSDLLELSLLENLQRENLNAMEISLSYKRLMDDLNYTQEQVAERMGKERSTVANYVRLLKLPPDIQIAVRNNDISMGHARALINVDSVDKQLHIYKEVKQKGLSVRQTEELVRRLYKEAPEKPVVEKIQLSPTFRKIEDSISSQFSTKVRMAHSAKGQGSITFEYYSLDELNSLLDKFNVTVS